MVRVQPFRSAWIYKLAIELLQRRGAKISFQEYASVCHGLFLKKSNLIWFVVGVCYKTLAHNFSPIFGGYMGYSWLYLGTGCTWLGRIVAHLTISTSVNKQDLNPRLYSLRLAQNVLTLLFQCNLPTLGCPLLFSPCLNPSNGGDGDSHLPHCLITVSLNYIYSPSWSRLPAKELKEGTL
jgi:hypothetical protein